jgi:F-box interacting protein
LFREKDSIVNQARSVVVAIFCFLSGFCLLAGIYKCIHPISFSLQQTCLRNRLVFGFDPSTMGGNTLPLESADVVREIFLKLATRDVAGCCCVCRLWRDLVADPSFRSLHAKTEASHLSAASEALLVMETREVGRSDEARVLSVSSSRPMPYHRFPIPSNYSLSNICNGLLCFAVDQSDSPVFLCNPVTGETATSPKAPPAPMERRFGTTHNLFALGFSPSTKEHKLFRFSYYPCQWNCRKYVDQMVCTLEGAGGAGGWRERSYPTKCPPLRTLPPLFVDGKLYFVTTGRTNPGQRRGADELLEVDVATEAHRIFCLPFGADSYHETCDPMVKTFEMSGRLCLAADLPRGQQTIVRKLKFWVLSSPPLDKKLEEEESKLCWVLCYSFDVGDIFFFHQRSAWFDDHEMTMCFSDSKAVFKHHTRARAPELSPDADSPQCDRRLQLPPKPSNCKWRICGGYRPGLLSPLTLAPPPPSSDGEEEIQEFEHAMLLALR